MSDSTAHSIFDVAIIGMGPVGKMAALLLGRAGHSIVVCERRESDYPLPRGVGLDAEIARLLQTAGLPPDLMPEVVQPYDDLYVWVNAADETIQEIDVSGIGPSGWNNTYFYNQPTLEGRLDAALRELPNVTIRRGVSARLAGQDDETVRLSIDDSGSADTVSARYLIGADGANSQTRQDAGIGWNDLGFFFDWLVVDVIPGDGVEITHLAKQICDPRRPTTVVPSGPGRRRWEFMLLPGETAEEITQPARIWELLAPFGVRPENSQLERGVVYTFAAGWAETWRSGRVLIAGDAAHLMPPFAAQGLASGFRDCLNLSWKLSLVLKGRASDSLLDSYQTERTNHVNGFIQFSMALGQVICITDPKVAAARDAQMIEAIRLQLAPPAPPTPRLGTGVHRGEHGGELSRQGRIVTDASTDPVRFDDIFGPGALIVRGNAASEVASLRNRLDELGIVVATFDTGSAATDNFADVQGTYGRWFDEWQTDGILVRPDFSVFGSADASTTVAELAERFALSATTGHAAKAQ